MIECSKEYIWYKKRRKSLLKKFTTIFIIFLILFVLYFHYKNNIAGQIYSVCSSYAQAYSTESVNAAVLTSMSIKTKYSDIINIEKNVNGDVILMHVDSVKVNTINKEIANNVELLLKEKLNNGVPIPLLLFSGIKLLSGYGPKIFYKSVNISSVSCDFDSSFESVGINQTLHSVYIIVFIKINIELPFKNNQVSYENRVLISESVLVGKVPETYLNGKIFG